jgi:hypothetical protein
MCTKEYMDYGDSYFTADLQFNAELLRLTTLLKDLINDIRNENGLDTFE